MYPQESVSWDSGQDRAGSKDPHGPCVKASVDDFASSCLPESPTWKCLGGDWEAPGSTL